MIDRDAFSAKTAEFWRLSQAADHNGHYGHALQQSNDLPDAEGRRAADEAPHTGSADQGAKDTPDRVDPATAAEREGDLATAMRLKNQQVRELLDSAGGAA